MPTAQQLRERLVGLLTELFQLNQPDLDFGFWRIMHAKAHEVTAFLRTDLLGIVAETFGRDSAARTAELQKAYEDAVARAKEYDAPDPEQAEPVKQAKAALDAAADTSRAEGEVYDHLYRFFERYYADGDFLSRRYYARETPGKAAPYAVPYDGSEVYLHWANKDQYYVKTAEYFTNFTFDPTKSAEVQGAKDTLFDGKDLPPLKVKFRIVAATEGEHGNVKAAAGQKRFFILHEPQPVYFEDGRLVVGFEFRPDPEKTGQDRTWQDKRAAEAVEKVLAALDALAKGEGDVKEADATLAGRPVADLAREYAAVLRAPAPTEKEKNRPLLAKYIAQYAARNTMDYFIHKDLGGFLRRELDFYLKNEVVRLDDIESADTLGVERYLDQVRVLRRIAHKIIAFLAQLEDFQKRLWLKKKFVVETNWCITLDRIPEEYYPEIAANDAQREEWVRLFAINEIKKDLHSPGYSKPLTVEFLKANPFLILDTAFFGEALTTRLLAAIDGLEENSNGLLVHAENFQALQLLRERTRASADSVYIDPPYNTDASAIMYKNNYKDASWLSLMGDRVALSTELLGESGVLCVAIDDVEFAKLRLLLGDLFSGGRILGVVAVRSNPAGRSTANDISVAHEYAIFASPSADTTIGRLERSEQQKARYDEKDDEGSFEWVNFRKHGGGAANREARPRMFYPILARDGRIRVPRMAWHEKKKEWQLQETPHAKEEVVWPINAKGEQKRWKWGHESVQKQLDDFCARPDQGGKMGVYMKSRVSELGMLPLTWWDKKEYSATEYGTNLLTHIFGVGSVFSSPKSVHLVEDCLRACGLGSDGTVIDYFGGSGTTAHAAINLNRLDDGNRRFVLVEMGNHFDAVLKPRVCKVGYSEEWRDGKPLSRDTGISQMLKYIRLESYEDALNNLAEPAPTPEQAKVLAENPDLREDYMLHYMLDVETSGSPSLLAIDAFTDPTAYRLKVKRPGTDEYEERPVDLLETFNYLVGLRVEHLAAPQTFSADFERPADPELPEDQRTRLTLKGKLKQDLAGPWWFRKVEGWLPRDRENPTGPDHEKVLIVWRKLTGDMEKDNLVLDEWFEANRINTRDWEFDTIYVNGSNNLPNLLKEGDTWKVRLIEEDFHRLMWDVEDV